MRTWLRIIVFSDALQLSALLCTTTLIRLLPWLMATSPPLEKRVNLYLIASLPFRPGSIHHFFIYSTSILADTEKEKSLKLYFISSFFCHKFSKMNIKEAVSLLLYLKKVSQQQYYIYAGKDKNKVPFALFIMVFKCSRAIRIPFGLLRVSIPLHSNLYFLFLSFSFLCQSPGYSRGHFSALLVSTPITILYLTQIPWEHKVLCWHASYGWKQITSEAHLNDHWVHFKIAEIFHL